MEKYRTLTPLFDELRGERVLVRPYRESDAQDLFDAIIESRDHIRRWLPFADHYQSVEDASNWIISGMAKWLMREDMTVGLWDIATHRYVGGSGIHPRFWQIGYFEIGYWLHVSATGRGYMTEAVRLLTDYAITHLNANRVEIRCDVQNEASAAVPRRLGYTLEGRLRNALPNHLSGGARDTLVFSMIPQDWHKTSL